MAPVPPRPEQNPASMGAMSGSLPAPDVTLHTVGREDGGNRGRKQRELLEHFGLREPPFRITPHTDFFFDGADRGATLEALIYAVLHDEGIVKIAGEVGSGKTMLCRVLIERLPPHVDTIYIATPSLAREEILHAIGDELGLELGGKRTTVALRELPFPMLSDLNRELSEQLGILEPGDKVALRATFVLDPEGIIRFVSVTDGSVGRNPEEVLRVLDALQTDELCPCNWQKGETTLNAA